jgi:hypothetical protein
VKGIIFADFASGLKVKVDMFCKNMKNNITGSYQY